MNEYYRGKIKVVGADLMCFPADPLTLAALACSSYDPWAISDPDTTPVETISCGEWNKRRADRRDQEQRDYYLRQQALTLEFSARPQASAGMSCYAADKRK